MADSGDAAEAFKVGMNTAGELLGQFGQKVRGFYRITADGVVETSQQLRGLDQADRAAALKLLAEPYGQPRIPESQFALPEGGLNRKFILPYDGAGVSGRTIFKPESGIDPAQRDWLSGEPGYVREINAYETSEKFKLGIVPRTWKAVHDTPVHGGVGSEQVWVPLGPAKNPGEYDVLDQQRMAILDYFTANEDRTGVESPNFGTAPDGSLVGFDHQLTHLPASGRTIDSKFTRMWLGIPLDPRVLGPIQAVPAREYEQMLLDGSIPPGLTQRAMDRMAEVQQNGMITGQAFIRWWGRR